MMSYLKGLIIGTPAQQTKPKDDDMPEDDLSRILTFDDMESIITSELHSVATLYQVIPAKRPAAGAHQDLITM